MAIAMSKKHKKMEGFELWFLKKQFTGEMRLRIYSKISKFLENGVPLPQALETLWTHMSLEGKKPKTPGALIMMEWLRNVLDGQSLSTAVRGWVPDGDLSVIEAGELSGKLDRALKDVVFMTQANKKIKAAVMGLAYPFVLVFMIFFYFWIFGEKVVPAFKQVLPVEKWQGLAVYLADVADYVQHGLLKTVIGMFVAIFLITNTFGIWTGKARQFADKFPPWSIYRLVSGTNFLVALASLAGAGVPMPDALRVIGKTGSRWYRQRVNATRKVVLDGAMNVGEALKRTGYEFPDPEMIIDIQSYAALDGFDEMLATLARQWLEDAILKIQGQIAILKNLALVVLGIVFMVLILGVFTLQEQVSHAAAG